jgi:Metallo-beta-lactamase superfamily
MSTSSSHCRGWSLDYILNTHHHHDHVGGNKSLEKQYHCHIVGPKADEGRIPGIKTALSEGEVFKLGATEFKVFDTPGARFSRHDAELGLHVIDPQQGTCHSRRLPCVWQARGSQQLVLMHCRAHSWAHHILGTGCRVDVSWCDCRRLACLSFAHMSPNCCFCTCGHHVY